jgi:DNA polymerase-3 subunit beta
VVVAAHLLAGQFPAFRNIIPKEHTGKFVAKRAEMLEALQRVGLMADGAHPVAVEFLDGGAILRSVLEDVGASDETVEGVYEGKDETLAFNPAYLAQALQVVPGDEVTLLTDGMKATLVQGDNGDLTYLVMPMKLRRA